MKFLNYLLFAIIAIPALSFAQKDEYISSGDIIKKGFVLYDSAQYKSALTEFNRVTRSDTNYVYSLYAKAVTCEADSQYSQAIKYCEEGLALKEQREYEPDLYNTYGNTLDDIGKPEEALKIFDKGIAKYPSFSLFYFNKGIALLALKRPAEAELLFQRTLLINPYMYSAHFQLGIAALHQGKIIPAALSFIGYLLVDPQGKYWSNSVNLLSAISNSTDAILDYKNKRTAEPGEDYAAVEEIVLSKIALDKAYKPIISIDDPISRQIQAIFEKLEYNDADNDFWMQYYVPYYRQVFTGGKFELFINQMFSSANVKAIKDYNKRNSKEIEQFKTAAADYFNIIRTTRELNYKKRDTVSVRYFFDDGQLVGRGTINSTGKAFTGPWESLYSPGNIKAKGNFSATGEREGNWVFYYFNGSLKTKQHNVNGKLDGDQHYYFDNGNLSSVEHYVNGLADGLITTYFYAGCIKSKINYKLDKKSGEEKIYHANGTLSSVQNYANGVLDGPSIEYYGNGNKKVVATYVNGKLNGDYKVYFETGALKYEGVYTNDYAGGAWNYYYEDGHIKEKRNFINDNEDGAHTEYYDNGQISFSATMKKGKIDGDTKSYYKEGQLLSTYAYDNGKVRSYKYYDRSGRQLSASQTSNNLIDIVSYSEDGIRNGHYFMDEKGDLTGPDTVFFPSGKIYQLNEYKNDQFDGLSVSYYLNGKIKSQINMTEGKENGYYTSYYTNGKMEAEGWIQAGDDEGQWNYYDELGRLTSVSNFVDGDLDGFKTDYDPIGKRTLEQKYVNGWLVGLTQFDDAGNVMAVDSFPKCSGRYKLVYSNGKTMAECDFLTGNLNGIYKTYYFDGSPQQVYHYKEGELDSTYVSYYYGGVKHNEGQYITGNRSGKWKLYDEDGHLLTVTTYANDMMNGLKVDYFENGKTDRECTYKDDKLEGLNIKYDPDGSLGYEVLFKDDKAVSYTYPGADGKLVPAIAIPAVNGVVKTYFANGKVSRGCTYSDGVKNGSDILYYTNGQLRSVDTVAYGISEGTSKYYYPNGKLKYEYHYVTDNATGACNDYRQDGTLKESAMLENGINNGPTKFYDTNGKLIKTLFYNYGTLISVKNEK